MASSIFFPGTVSQGPFLLCQSSPARLPPSESSRNRWHQSLCLFIAQKHQGMGDRLSKEIPHCFAPVATVTGLADSASLQESSKATRHWAPLLTDTPISVTDSLRTLVPSLALRGMMPPPLLCPLSAAGTEATESHPHLTHFFSPSPSPHSLCV